MSIPHSFPRLALLAATCAAVLAIAFLPGYDTAVALAAGLGYWVLAALVAAFGYFTYMALRAAGGGGVRRWLAASGAGLAVVVAVSVFLQLHEPHRPKVLYDEDTLCGTAMQMHFERQAAYPARAHYIDDSLQVTSVTVDKRPVFFPFALSIVHDLTGYRPSNVFILNALATFALLALLYAWARPVAGDRVAVAAVLLLGGLPLLAQNATGAGFEVLNLALIAALALAGRRYLSQPGSGGLDMLICIGVMLATTRYESALYLVAMAVIVLAKWVRQRRVTLTWFSAISPLFVLPLLLTNRVFLGNDGFFQAGEGAFLSAAFLPENLSRAVYFLFSGPFGISASSLLLSAAGALCLLLVGVRCITSLVGWKNWDATTLAFAPILAAALANTLLGLLEHWGQWTDPMAARFSLPFHLAMAMCVVLALSGAGKRLLNASVAISAGWLLLFAPAQMARHDMTDLISVSREAEFFRDWVNENAGPRDLVLGDSSIAFIVDGHASVPFLAVNRAPWKIGAVLKSGIYEEVFVCQRFVQDDAGIWRPANDALSPALSLREIARLRCQPGTLAVISAVTGVDDPAAPDPMPNTLADILP